MRSINCCEKKSVCQTIPFPKHLAQLKNWLFKIILAVLSRLGKNLSANERASTLKTNCQKYKLAIIKQETSWHNTKVESFQKRKSS